MKKYRFFIIGITAIYLLRFVISQGMGLMPQDAYYFFYSEHPALSYFDHPPMVAYMLKLFSTVFGKSVSVVKLTDFIVTLGSFYGFYLLGKKFLSERAVIKTSFFYATTFLLTILSINTTPDVPLIFFWTFSLLAVYRAVYDKKLIYWILSGILMGLAFDSKYTALFLPFGLILFLIISKEHRHYLFSWELLLTVIFFLITISPIFIWNIQNDWISFKFQSSERAGSISKFNLKPLLFLGNVGTQMFLLIPVLFTAMFVVFYKYGRKFFKKRTIRNSNDLFLLSFSVPVIGFFLLVSLFYWVKLNWMMPGYVAGVLLAGRFLSYKLLRTQIYISVVLHVLLFVQVFFYPVNVKSDDTWYGWEELSENVKDLEKKYPDHFIFSADNYKTSAILDFYLDQDIYSGNVLGKQALQFSVVYPDLSFLNGKDALFIDSDKKLKNDDRSNKMPRDLETCFDKVIQLDPILIKSSQGKLRRKFYVYECIKYHKPEIP